MAIKKICGIETEYGIIHQGTEEFNPAYSSSVLISAYLAAQESEHPRWDFNDEMPGNDARGFSRADVLSPDMHPQLANAILLNGARYYVDHAHPEISSPECGDALSAVLYDCAADVIMQRSMENANEMLPEGEQIIVYKNNSDGKGNSYGCHENYLMDRSVPFAVVAQGAMAHLITRQIYCGAGKVGTEIPGEEPTEGGFQITSRADFIEEQIGLETTIKRPIINTRDEPHADYRRFRRLHVIVGDANMSQAATLLKVGTTAFLLAMIEDDFLTREIIFANPVAAMRNISRDLSLAEPQQMSDGTQATALDIQWELYEMSRKFSEMGGLEHVGENTGQMVLDRWEQVLTGLEDYPASLAQQLDWVAKHRLISGYRDRHNLSWDDPRLKAFDLQYHDLRPEKCIASRLGLEEIVAPEAVLEATATPPNDTRAYFRGRCLEKFGSHILAANWDSVLFAAGDDSLQRITLLDPMEGETEELARLFDMCETPAQLLEQMGGKHV